MISSKTHYEFSNARGGIMINALIKIKNQEAQAIYKSLKSKRKAIEYLLINAIKDKEFVEKYTDKDLLEFF